MEFPQELIHKSKLVIFPQAYQGSNLPIYRQIKISKPLKDANHFNKLFTVYKLIEENLLDKQDCLVLLRGARY